MATETVINNPYMNINYHRTGKIYSFSFQGPTKASITAGTRVTIITNLPDDFGYRAFTFFMSGIQTLVVIDGSTLQFEPRANVDINTYPYGLFTIVCK